MTLARADFLDEMIAARTSPNPAFPALLDAAAVQRRQVETEPVGDDAPEAK